MVESQPDHEDAIQEFLSWEASPNTFRTGRMGAKNETPKAYIPFIALDAYFKTPESVKKILTVLFPDGSLGPHYVYSHYRCVLAILLSTHNGHMIRQFVEHSNLQDRNLPLEAQPSNFPVSSNDDLWTAFHDRQWKYLPLTLDYNMQGRLPTNRILPFQVQEQVGKGVSAYVNKVLVDEEYNKLNHPANLTARPSTFVIKTYREREAKKNFEREKAAFERLNRENQPPPNIIGFHGSFIRDGTYNLILEYADMGTLRDFMRLKLPPSRGEDIIGLWRNLCGLLLGLQAIHETEVEGSSSHFISGWHQDVKPTNILVKSTGPSVYDCEFVLADLGLSHFKHAGSSHRDVTDKDSYGTYAYSAPETYRIDRASHSVQISVARSVDVWSLGCVWSEVVTWTGHGWPGVEEYRLQRKQEVARKLHTQEDGDLFHDGERVLEAVQESHNTVCNSRRVDDFITPKFARDVIPDMMETKQLRLSTMQAHGKAIKALRAADEELQNFRNTIPLAQPGNTVSTLFARPSIPIANNVQPDDDSSRSSVRSGKEVERSQVKSDEGAIEEVPPPRISVKNVLQWREGKKSGNEKQLPDAHLLGDIKNRDHMFLIDNTASMAAHRSELLDVLQAIASTVKEYDPNGVDMVFTQSERKVLSTKKTSHLLREFDKVNFRGTTDMQIKLGHRLEEYKCKITGQQGLVGRLKNIIRAQGRPRPLSLYILTDGVWHPGCDVSSVIASMVDCLVKHDLRLKQVAIQFIRFGADEDAIAILQHLDDGLGLPLDIVDTTASDGNVWKMILGAIHIWFDNDK